MSAVQAAVVTDSPVVVAVDVGKKTVALSVTDAGRHRLLGPVDFEMTGRGVDGVLALISSRLAGADAPVKVGIEAAGHYHRPLLAPSVWPAGWQVLESVAIRKWPEVTIYWGWASSTRTFPEEPTKAPSYPGSSLDGWGLFCVRQG
ncbi:transposase [Arthrobacter sp. ok909]|uniref:IS110 family transposase n=1 Tax=Arthrobacter sp. ok909 TaxID=1761746 RepID=UPI00158765F8|nr:transposase [Arthrobacter sp. ok909]